MKTIDSLINQTCLKYPEKTAFCHKVKGHWKSLSYRCLWQMVEQIASGLVKQGLKPGEHVAIIASSSPRWVAAHLGILRAGGIVIPVDKELKSAELRHILFDSDSKLLFTENSYLDNILEISADLPLLQKIVLLSETGDDNSTSPEISATLEELANAWRELRTTSNIPESKASRLEILALKAHRLLIGLDSKTPDETGAKDFLSSIHTIRNNLLNEHRLLNFSDILIDSAPPPSTRTPSDTAVILYTSGTTGRSKGAMLSHANITSNIRECVNLFKLDEHISTLSFLPINHVFEQVCGILLPLSLGGKISFAESIKKLGENLSEVKPTFLLGVPAVYSLILNRIKKNIEAKPLAKLLFSIPLTRFIISAKAKKKLGQETLFVSGGAALDPSISKGFKDLGLTLYQGYGITETSPVISAETITKNRPGTVGSVLNDVQVEIVSANEEGIGEILVKGPNVMQGYYKNPKATAEVLKEGWYHTGDLGKIDGDGYLHIAGRVKNLIVTPNGKNVYPEEVENELLKSPYVAEVMVYGHKVSPTAEEVYAVIFPDQEALDDYEQSRNRGPLTEMDVEKLIRNEVLQAGKNMADYKRVRKFTLREDEFPKTTTRKIKRYAVEPTISTTD